MSNIVKVELTSDEPYLGDKKDFAPPRRSYIKAGTGTGKTTYFCNLAKQGKRVLIASSVTTAVTQLQKLHQKGVTVAVAYEKEKTIITADTRLIVCTYDQVATVAKKLDRSKWVFVIDEAHNIALADYRKPAIRRVLNEVNNDEWAQIALMSGTPIYMPHSALAEFEFVKVDHWQREQKAVMVTYGKKIGRIGAGVKLALDHKEDIDPIVIHLDNKGKQLNTCISKLVAGGFDIKTICILNSDTKYEGVGNHIAEHEQLPDDCEVLICTSVFVESLNLKTKLSAVIVLSIIHPFYAQQLVSRQRGKVAPDVVYVLTSGQGDGYSFDERKEYEYTIVKHAKHLIALQNEAIVEMDYFGIDLKKESVRALFGGHWGGLIKKGDNGYEIDELGVIQHVAKAVTKYTNNNPKAYKAMLEGKENYNWTWEKNRHIKKDELVIDTTMSKLALKELEKQRLEDYKKRVALVHRMGDVKAEWATITGLTEDNKRVDGRLRRVIDRMLEASKMLGDWDRAAGLVAMASDSTRAHHHTIDLITAQKVKENGDRFVLSLANMYDINDAVTQDERYEAWKAIYAGDAEMRAFVEPTRRFSFSKEAKPRISKQMVNELFKLFYEVKREQVGRGLSRVSVYVITGHNPLEAAIKEGMIQLKEGQALLKEQESAICTTPAPKNNTKQGVVHNLNNPTKDSLMGNVDEHSTQDRQLLGVNASDRL